jgi:hypothetical protein
MLVNHIDLLGLVPMELQDLLLISDYAPVLAVITRAAQNLNIMVLSYE